MKHERDWTLTLKRLRRELNRELESLQDLRAVDARREEIASALIDLDHQLARAREAAVIVLTGSTGAGKSTTLNALAGREIAVEGESRPTTSVPTVYAPNDADLSALLDSLEGPEPRVVRHEVGRHQAGANEGMEEDSRRANARFADQILIDAPDVNSVASEHRATVRALAERADVLLVVLHRQSVVEESAVTFLEGFAHKRRLVFALNRADELNEDSRRGLLEQIGELAAKRLGVKDAPRFAISARSVREGRADRGWDSLLDELERLVQGSALASVRRHNAVGAAAEVGQIFESIREEVGADLVELPQAVRTGLEELVERTNAEVDERLALRRADLGNLLTAETGRRWDGPGGWSLRAGAFSTVGAGLGLALARRNPLAAAGVAAGGAVVSKVRAERGRSHLEDPVGLLPEDGDLKAIYTASLGPARLIGGRLAGEPELLGVPGLMGLSVDLQQSVTESWQHLLRRQLPEAAERSSPWWIRWPLDLPVYAFAGWLLWRAAEGFIAEDYVGFDFLVNGVLLALAMVFLVRLIIRSTIVARAGRLVRGVAQRAAEKLASARDDLARPAERLAAQRLASLEYLSNLEQRFASEFDQRED